MPSRNAVASSNAPVVSCSPALRPRGHHAPDLASEWPLTQRLPCMLGMCWLGPPGSRLSKAAAAAPWRTQAARYSSSRLTTASCSCRGPACAGSAHQGHRAHRPPRFSTQQGCGGHVTKDERLHAASRPASRLLAALASSLRPTSRRPAALAVAQRVPAQPTRDIKRTACLDSPRFTSRLPAALAAARRVLARPVRDMERTAYLGSRLGAVVAAPPRAQVPTTCHCHISPSDSCGGPA